MSNKFNRFTNKELTAAALAVLAGTVVGVFAVESSDEQSKINKVQNQATTFTNDTLANLKVGGTISLLAGIVEVDPGVNYRTEPAELNGSSNSFLSVDETNDLAWHSTTKATFIRPIILTNTDQLNKKAPTEWIGGIDPITCRVEYVGLSEATNPYVHLYQATLGNAQEPELIQNVEINKVIKNTAGCVSSIEFTSANGTEETAGLMFSSNAANFLQDLSSIGHYDYHEVPDPLVK